MANSHDTAPGLHVVTSEDLACTLVLARPHQPGELLVITSGHVTALQLVMFASVALGAAEREQLAGWLELHGGLITRPMDWPRGDE